MEQKIHVTLAGILYMTVCFCGQPWYAAERQNVTFLDRCSIYSFINNPLHKCPFFKCLFLLDLNTGSLILTGHLKLQTSN